MSEGAIEKLENSTQYIQPRSREFYAFLLRGSANSQSLPLNNLPTELKIVATGSHLTEESKRQEIQDLKRRSKKLAKELAEKYNLGDQDSIALEQLLLGFTQASLLESKGRNPYEIVIHTGVETGYSLEKQHGIDSMNASTPLFNIINSEIFDQIALIDEGLQVRVSSNPLFYRSAARVNTIIDTLSKGPLYYSPKFVEVVPLHKVADRIQQWQDYLQQVSSSTKVE